MINQIVDTAIQLVQNSQSSEKCKLLGLTSYIREYRILNLGLPRQAGKSTYIKNKASENDIILYPSMKMMLAIGQPLSNAYSIDTLINNEFHIAFEKKYSIIWLDEFRSDVFEDPKYTGVLKSFVYTGKELFVNLTSG